MERVSSRIAGTAPPRGILVSSRSRFRIGIWDAGEMKPGEVGIVAVLCMFVEVSVSIVIVIVKGIVTLALMGLATCD